VCVSKKTEDRWCEYGGACLNVFKNNICNLIEGEGRYRAPYVPGWGCDFTDEIIQK